MKSIPKNFSIEKNLLSLLQNSEATLWLKSEITLSMVSDQLQLFHTLNTDLKKVQSNLAKPTALYIQ